MISSISSIKTNADFTIKPQNNEKNPKVNNEKLSQIAEKIAAGTYKIDLEATAKAIAGELCG